MVNASRRVPEVVWAPARRLDRNRPAGVNVIPVRIADAAFRAVAAAAGQSPQMFWDIRRSALAMQGPLVLLQEMKTALSR